MDKKLQDELIGALIGLARATEGTSPTKEIYQTIIQGLTKYNSIDISDDEVRDLIQNAACCILLSYIKFDFSNHYTH